MCIWKILCAALCALLLTGCAAPAPSETSTLVAVNLETLEASEPFA